MSEQESIIGMALEAGFMLSTAHGQSDGKLMPVSDSATLRKFAELVTAAAQRERDEAWNAAIGACMDECLKSAKRPHPDTPDAVGARNCMEIREAILALYRS